MAGRWRPQRFRKIPTHVRNAISALGDDAFALYAIRRLEPAAVGAGEWAHLGIVLNEDGAIVAPDSYLPDPSAGRAARVNRDGDDKPRTDLPKYTKTFSFETPNFGDASTYGTHTHYRDREVYPREIIPADGLAIRMSILSITNDGAADVSFQVDRVFDTSTVTDTSLLRACSLLQESVGDVRVRASNEPLADYRARVEVQWEFLPVGNRAEAISQARQRLQPRTPAEDGVLVDRMTFLDDLSPTHFLTGTSGFARYVGAQFEEDLVVFENLRYGNAAYVMYADWPTLSRRTRLELLGGDWDGFDRVIHTDKWKERVAHLVAEHRTGLN